MGSIRLLHYKIDRIQQIGTLQSIHIDIFFFILFFGSENYQFFYLLKERSFLFHSGFFYKE